MSLPRRCMCGMNHTSSAGSVNVSSPLVSQFASPAGMDFRASTRDSGAMMMNRRSAGAFASVNPIIVWSAVSFPLGV